MLSIRRIISVLFLCTLFCAVQARGEGLTVAILGDSNAWLAGENCESDSAWPFWFVRSYNPVMVKNYARSGATWTHTPKTKVNTQEYSEVITDDNVIMNQLERLKADVEKGNYPMPELIIISAGTNDAWFPDKRPRVFSSSESAESLAGSIKNGGEYISRNFPGARVVLLTPPFSSKIESASINRAGDIMLKAGKESGMDIIRLDTAEFIDGDAEKIKFRLTSDGVHTSRAGARKIGFHIASEIEKFLKGE